MCTWVKLFTISLWHDEWDKDVESEINQSPSGSLGTPQPSHKSLLSFHNQSLAPYMQACLCKPTTHIYFNSSFDCGTEGGGAVIKLATCSSTIHKQKKQTQLDDEGKIVKSKCFLAHWLIVSRLQTDSHWCRFCLRTRRSVYVHAFAVCSCLHLCVCVSGGGRM